MTKTILLTGATDGIGFATAKMLAEAGHELLLHGRSGSKLDDTVEAIRALSPDANITTYLADLADIGEVDAMTTAILESRDSLDVIINNAGVFKAPNPVTGDGLDIRFVVNTLAPYRLTQRLLPLLGESGRVINVSSAAQAPVEPEALSGRVQLADFDAYAQSKLAITMWSRHLAERLGESGPIVVSVNPGSLLGTKMVQEGFGVDGNDIAIGAGILVRAAVSDEFATASGGYFDNDSGKFAPPHADALDPAKVQSVVGDIESILAKLVDA